MLNARGIFLILSSFLYLGISYFTDRSHSILLLSQIGILYVFLIYLWLTIRNENNASDIKFIQWSAIFLRLILLFSFPNLSDDVYRFLWDGMLSNNSINPYLVLPENFEGIEQFGQHGSLLLESMNSTAYYTVYPPLDQSLFSVASFLSHKLEIQIFILKLILFLSELMAIYYLPKLLFLFKLDPKLSMLYLLNPLVILEGVGNLHFEVFSISFLISFFYFLFHGNMLKSGVSFALAAGIKLLPLIFIPALYRYFGLKKTLIITLSFAVINGLFFVPFFEVEVFKNFLSSIDLYFHRFEFNASFYYLIREIGYLLVGYNVIALAGTVLAITSLLIIIFIAYKVKKQKIHSLLKALFFSVLIYYLFSTTVHPWYLINLLFLAICTGFLRSVVLWTFLVFLSYTAYSSPDYHENLWIVSFTYIIFLIAFYFDFKQRRLNERAENRIDIFDTDSSSQ